MRKIRILSLMLALVMLAGILASCGGTAASPENEDKKGGDNVTGKLGLYLENGKVMHEGKEYRAVGVNYFSAFYYSTVDILDSDYIDNFKILKEYEIPYCRINMGGFGASDFKMWMEDPNMYFGLMDQVVAEAGKNNIGLICSLFWYFPAFPDLAGEPINAMADPNSKTWQLMKKYITDVVSRYKDNPTIWAWEFGNEYNLMVDLPNAKEHRPPIWEKGTRKIRDENDDLTTDDLQKVLVEFAKTVRSIDPYRLITTGHGQPRGCAYDMRMNKGWNPDTREEMAEVMRWQNPDPIDTVSVHIYTEEKDRLEPMDTWAGIIKVFMEECEKMGKVLFVGEFGYPDDPKKPETHEFVKQEFKRLLDEIVKQKVPLSAVWNFGIRDDTAFDIHPKRTNRGYQLELIREANKQIKAEMEGQ